MEAAKVERLGHLGVVAGVTKDLRIVELIDERIVPDEQEEISTGEAIAGMIPLPLRANRVPHISIICPIGAAQCRLKIETFSSALRRCFS